MSEEATEPAVVHMTINGVVHQFDHVYIYAWNEGPRSQRDAQCFADPDWVRVHVADAGEGGFR